MNLGTKVGLSPGDVVLDGDPAPSQKGAKPPIFGHLYCGQTVGCINMPLVIEVGLIPGGFVLDGNPVPTSKRGRSPQFSVHIYCGQMAGWIKMPLGTEVGLGSAQATLC